jgi:hypothetical protein
VQKCESYKKLFLKLKEREEHCYQLREQINFARQLHQKFNQIKSVDTQLKPGIAESFLRVINENGAQTFDQ